MCKNLIEKIKSKISIEMVLEKYGYEINKNSMSICPIHQDTNPSLKIFEDGHFHCYGCGAKGDVIDLVAQIEKKPVKTVIHQLANDCDNYNFLPTTDKIVVDKIKKPRLMPTFENLSHIRDYINRCHKEVIFTDFFKKRGFTNETIERFKVGYDKELKQVVFPYNSKFTYFQRRSINGKIFYKVKSDIAGSEPLYNQAILKKDCPIFVVESPMCAMSIEQCGGNALALCGVPNYEKVIKWLSTNHFAGELLLSLDNDNAGIKATKDFAQKLNELNVPYQIVNIADNCKDPNELLIKNAIKLKTNIMNVLNKDKVYAK